MYKTTPATRVPERTSGLNFSKFALTILAIFSAGLMGCSQFESDSDDSSLNADGDFSAIRGKMTSSKLASEQELADTKALAELTNYIQRAISMQTNLPLGFQRLSGLTSSSSEMGLVSDLRQRLSTCRILKATERERNLTLKRYSLKPSELCEMNLDGSYRDSTIRKGNVQLRNSTEILDFQNLNSELGQIAQVILRLEREERREGQLEFRSTFSKTIITHATLEVILWSGEEYELEALSDDRSTQTLIADNYSEGVTTKRFMAGSVVPSEENMVYEWYLKEGTDLKTEEYQEINEIRIDIR